MIYGFMEAEKARFPIRFMASRLEVSTSGFYEWRKRRTNPSQRTIEDARLTETICEIYERSRGTYGSPRVWAELRYGLGIRVGRKRVERLMRLAGISGITRRKGYRRRRVSGPIAADLVQRQFSPSCPDRLWLSDITQHPTREGTVYLAVVIDAWNREVIGWSITDHLRGEIVCDAFDMARWRRQPQPGSGLVCHSDHGSQNTSWAFWEETPPSRDPQIDRNRRRRVGQRGSGVVLRHPPHRATGPLPMGNPPTTVCGHLRVHRRLVQPRKETLLQQPPKPRQLPPPTTTGGMNTNQNSPANRGNLTAVICVARRRCDLILAMLKTKTPYNPTRHQKTPETHLTKR